ncbi:MAG: hypothetical protein KAI79_17120 [Bacteroidales bacterium]|nr:hypothetical protein [Bacteroidales bacterium]
MRQSILAVKNITGVLCFPFGKNPSIDGKGAFIMENVLDLKMPGVQELGREELREVDGGFLCILILSYVYRDEINEFIGDFKEGVVDGFNENKI